MRLSASEAASRGNGGRSDFLRRPPRLLFVAAETPIPPPDARGRGAAAAGHRSSRPRSRGSRIAGIAATDPNAVPLPEADFIVSAGNGVSDWASFP